MSAINGKNETPKQNGQGKRLIEHIKNGAVNGNGIYENPMKIQQNGKLKEDMLQKSGNAM